MQLKRLWNAPTSLAIKTVCLLTPKSQLSHLVFDWDRQQEQPVALAKMTSAKSADGLLKLLMVRL